MLTEPIPLDPVKIQQAACLIRQADALLIAAGAGMGVDSGLPDFRGIEGFWRAYPPFAKRGLRFEEVANPRHFRDDPAMGWGFYGHRRNLYRATTPHEGFAILRRWAANLRYGGFVFTSNVDGQFERDGFDPDRIVEIHGSIHFDQCLVQCGQQIFTASSGEVAIDPATFLASRPFPACPSCGSLARPNILMFGDGGWDSTRTDAQLQRFEEWIGGTSSGRIVIVEIGAGSAIPTVRNLSDNLVREAYASLIRINPREPEVPRGQVGLASSALLTLRTIDQLVRDGS